MQNIFGLFIVGRLFGGRKEKKEKVERVLEFKHGLVIFLLGLFAMWMGWM